MGRMLDALRQIESAQERKSKPERDASTDNPAQSSDRADAIPSPAAVSEAASGSTEAELSFPDDLLAETAALLDDYEQAAAETQVSPQVQTPVLPVAEEKLSAAAEPSASTPHTASSVAAGPRDPRYVDLAMNILSMPALPLNRRTAEKPANPPGTGAFAAAQGSLSTPESINQPTARSSLCLLCAAVADGGVFAASLAPLFETLAERADGRTLVVECDFRRPALASRFSLVPRLGFEDVLARPDQWQSAVCRTEQANLDVICSSAAGAQGVQAQQARPSLQAMIAQMQEQYRLVLLESVSISGDELPQLAALCQGVYLLLRSGRTSRRAARWAVTEINRGGGQLLGCILLDA